MLSAAAASPSIPCSARRHSLQVLHQGADQVCNAAAHPTTQFSISRAAALPALHSVGKHNSNSSGVYGSSGDGSGCRMSVIAHNSSSTLDAPSPAVSCSYTTRTAPSPTPSSNVRMKGCRKSVIARDKKPNRNPYLELEKDLLPDGKPNTPWRRIQLKIRNTTSLQGLLKVYLLHRHKSAVWRAVHSAGILMRVAALYYYRVILPPYAVDDRTSLAAVELLTHLAPDLTNSRVLHVLDSARLAQVLVVLAALNPHPPAEVVDPLIREVMREGAKKLPVSKPDLLAELAAALAKLQWREEVVWLAVAAAVKGQLRANQLQRQQQPDSWHQQHTSSGQQEHQEQQQQIQLDDGQHQPLLQQQEGVWTSATTPPPPLPQQQQTQGGWWQQPQAQASDTLRIYDHQPAYSNAAVGDIHDEDGSADHFEDDAELDDEEWYAEDPAYLSLPADKADTTTSQLQQQQKRQQQQQQQQWQAPTAQPCSSKSSSGTGRYWQGEGIPWLSMCYPKIAAAVAAVGLEDAELMQLLGMEAVHVLPLLSPHELADLAAAYAQLSTAHAELLHAISLQVQENVAYMESSSRGQQQQRDSDVVAVIRTAHALGQLGFSNVQLVHAVQTAVLSSGTGSTFRGHASSGTGSIFNTTAAAVGPEQYVQVLQLAVQSGCATTSSSSSTKSPVSPLVKRVCTAVAASGLEALQPAQLAAAAVALVELQHYQEAAAAAAVLGAAAVARAHECGPEIMADVLWCCETLGCANAILADEAVFVLECAAEKGQQPQPQARAGRTKGSKKSTAKQKAAAAAAAVPVGPADFGLVPSMHGGGAEQLQAPQQLAVLSSRHQALLVLSLQQMGRGDLVQRALLACGVLHSSADR